MKLRFLAGVAAGYVFGTRAGRERYEQLAESVRGMADSDLFRQARDEITRLTGGDKSSADDRGLASPPVIVGPGPDGATGSPNTDVVLPDLESSDAGSPSTEPPSARRVDPPAGG